MQTIFFGRQTPPEYFFTGSRQAKTNHYTNQAVLPVLKSDVMEVRFGQTLSVNERAWAFSQVHGKRLDQFAVNANRALWSIYEQSDEEAVQRLNDLTQAELATRINPAAYKELQDLLRPGNREKIQHAWTLQHLQMLMDEGRILPDTPQNRQLIETEATLKDLATQMTGIMGESPKKDSYPSEEAYQAAQQQLGQKYSELYETLLRKRNEFAKDYAKAHHRPDIKTFYDYALAEQGLSAPLLDTLFDQIEAKYEQVEARTGKGLYRLGSALLYDGRRLSALLAGRQLSSRDIILQSAKAIGQPAPIANVLKRSILNGEHSSTGATGIVLPIDAPHDVRAVAPMSEGAASVDNRLETAMHEVMGHGLAHSFIDPTLPPQYRNDRLPFSPVAGEGMGLLWQTIIYREDFWTDVLKFRPEEIEPFKKELAYHKLMSRIIHREQWDKRLYNNNDPEARNYVTGAFFTTNPVWKHNYPLARAWSAQVEAAMTKKYGSIFNQKAWEEIRKIFSLSKLIDLQEQMKLLTAKPQEVNRIVALLRGTPAQFEEGKREIKKSSGQYFSMDALSQEIDQLAEILTQNFEVMQLPNYLANVLDQLREKEHAKEHTKHPQYEDKRQAIAHRMKPGSEQAINQAYMSKHKDEETELVNRIIIRGIEKLAGLDPNLQTLPVMSKSQIKAPRQEPKPGLAFYPGNNGFFRYSPTGRLAELLERYALPFREDQEKLMQAAILIQAPELNAAKSYN